MKMLLTLAYFFSSHAFAMSTSTQLIVQVTISSVCLFKSVTPNIDAQYVSAFDFRCNAEGAVYLSIEGTSLGGFSMASDCSDKQATLMVPLGRPNQRVYVCDVQADEHPLITFMAQ